VKAHAVVPADVGAERLVGWAPCHDVRDAEGRLVARKGRRLDRDTAERLIAIAPGEVHLLEIEAGDLHEDPAGERLARTVAGTGVGVRDSSGGQWALTAETRGLLQVAIDTLAAVNALEGISVYTLFDGQVVDRGDVVAKAKVTPLVIPEAAVLDAELRAGEAGLATVKPFRARPIGAVAPEALQPRTRDRFERGLQEKLAWLGAPLTRLTYARADAGVLARELTGCLAAGAEILVAAGANALDPLDPLFGAIARLGGRSVRLGVPAHPGSLLWLARLGQVPVLGMPSCGMFSQATAFDLVLPRMLAGEDVGGLDLAALGHGGLLSRDMAFRFPPYRPDRERGSVGEPSEDGD
jgi:hypothetical protein